MVIFHIEMNSNFEYKETCEQRFKLVKSLGTKPPEQVSLSWVIELPSLRYAPS